MQGDGYHMLAGMQFIDCIVHVHRFHKTGSGLPYSDLMRVQYLFSFFSTSTIQLLIKIKIYKRDATVKLNYTSNIATLASELEWVVIHIIHVA